MLTSTQRSAFERAAANAYAVGQGGRARELVRLLGDPPDVRNVPERFWSALEAEMARALTPVFFDVAVASALGLGTGAGIMDAVNWQAVNERAAAWSSRYTFKLVAGINTTTRDMLRVEIARFFRTPTDDLKTLASRLQPGTPELLSRLGQVLSSQTRAQMIATTEVTRAAAEGEQRMVDQIKADNPKVNVVGVWLTSADEIVCPKICIPLNGAHDDGRGNFINPKDGQPYRLPGHPWCRCARGTIIQGL